MWEKIIIHFSGEEQSQCSDVQFSIPFEWVKVFDENGKEKEILDFTQIAPPEIKVTKTTGCTSLSIKESTIKCKIGRYYHCLSPLEKLFLKEVIGDSKNIMNEKELITNELILRFAWPFSLFSIKVSIERSKPTFQVWKIFEGFNDLGTSKEITEPVIKACHKVFELISKRSKDEWIDVSDPDSPSHVSINSDFCRVFTSSDYDECKNHANKLDEQERNLIVSRLENGEKLFCVVQFENNENYVYIEQAVLGKEFKATIFESDFFEETHYEEELSNPLILYGPATLAECEEYVEYVFDWDEYEIKQGYREKTKRDNSSYYDQMEAEGRYYIQLGGSELY